MRYFFIDGDYYPEYCIWGPRPLEGIIFNNSEWCRFHEHLTKRPKERDAAEVLAWKQQQKKLISSKMTAGWENTLASIKTLREQQKLELKRKDEQARMDEYNKIIENQRQEKENIIREAKKMLYQEKDTTKQLASSLAFSAVLYERNKQKQFNQMLRQKALEAEARYAEEVRRKAEEFEEEEYQEKLRDIEKKRQFRQTLDEQMEYVFRNRDRAEYEKVLERQDQINMQMKMDEMQEKDKQEQLNRRNYLKSVIERFNENERAAREQRRREEKEDDKINEIFTQTKRKIDEERETKEKEYLRIPRAKVAYKLVEAMMAKEDKDDEKLQREIMKKDEDYYRKFEERKSRRDKLIQELLEAEREAKEKAAKDEILENERRKWEIVQKLRRQHMNEIWNAEEKALRNAITRDVRDGYLEQWKENAEKKVKEKLEDRKFLEDPTKDKEDVLKYCDQVLDYTKRKERPSFPVLTTITKVKRQIGVRERTKPIKFLQSNVPIESISIYAKKKTSSSP